MYKQMYENIQPRFRPAPLESAKNCLLSTHDIALVFKKWYGSYSLFLYWGLPNGCSSCPSMLAQSKKIREYFQSLGKASKKNANYPHFVDERLTPPYSLWPKLIIFTLRNFFYPHLLTPCLSCPYSLFLILMIIIFSLLIMARYRLNTTKVILKWPKSIKKCQNSSK